MLLEALGAWRGLNGDLKILVFQLIIKLSFNQVFILLVKEM